MALVRPPRALLLIAAFGAAMISGCASRPSVGVALVGLAPLESSLFEQRLQLDFRLQNFGERTLRADGLEVALAVNGQRLARGVDSGAFEVGRLDESRVSVVVSTSLIAVARQILEMTSRETFSYSLSGRVHLAGWGGSVPFAHTGEITREELARLAGLDGARAAPLELEPAAPAP